MLFFATKTETPSVDETLKLIRRKVEQLKAVVLDCCDNVSVRRSRRSEALALMGELAAQLGTLNGQTYRRSLGDYQDLSILLDGIRREIGFWELSVLNCQALVRWLLYFNQADDEFDVG